MKNYIKKFTQILPVLLVMVCLLGCTQQTAAIEATSETTLEAVQDTPITLINPLGPAVIPLAGILSGETQNSASITVQYWSTLDEATGLLAGDDVNFAVLPISVGANLSASGMDLVLLGVHEWKVFYLLAAPGETFNGWDSLVGKTVYSPESKGQTVDVLTRYALSSSGIDPDKDVTFVYAPTQEIVALFKEGKVEYAALPEPFVSLALSQSDGKIVLDYQEYWNEVNGTQYGIPIAGLFVKRSFLTENPAAVEMMVNALTESSEWSNDNPEETLTAVSDVLTLPQDVMLNALRRMKFEYIGAQAAKQSVLDFLNAIQTTYPEGIKAVPGDDFFAQ